MYNIFSIVFYQFGPNYYCNCDKFDPECVPAQIICNQTRRKNMSDDDLAKEDSHQKAGFHPDDLVVITELPKDSDFTEMVCMNATIIASGFIDITTLAQSQENSERKQIRNVTQPDDAWEKFVPRWNFRDFPHCMQIYENISTIVQICAFTILRRA